MNIVFAFLILLLVITIHEWGHFIAARITGVKVYEFAIGFGPVIYSRMSKGTKFSIRLLPLGGFCGFDNNLANEEGSSVYDLENKQEDSEFVELPDASFFSKMFIILNGIIMNFILAFIIYTGIFAINGSQTMIIDNVFEDSVASEVGISTDDIILEINGRKVNNIEELTSDKDFLSDKGFDLLIERDGNQISMNVPSLKEKGLLGVSFKVKKSIVLAIKSTINIMGLMLGEIFHVFSRMLVKVDDGMMGIVGFVGFMSKQPEINFIFILTLIAGISVSVGAFNLLPIVPLDGGQAVIYIIEKIIGHSLSDKVKNIISLIGMAFMLYLFVRVTFSDIVSL